MNGFQIRTKESKLRTLTHNSLFRIISRISEYSRIKPVLDAITAMDHDTMFPCLYEFIIKKDTPLHIKQFMMAMSHEVGRQCFVPKMVC